MKQTLVATLFVFDSSRVCMYVCMYVCMPEAHMLTNLR